MPTANRFVKTKGHAPHGTESIDLRTRSPEIGTASAFTARYPDTKSSINQRPGFTTHRLRRELVEIASALLLRSAGAEGEAVAQVAAGGILERLPRFADRRRRCVYWYQKVPAVDDEPEAHPDLCRPLALVS
jgi:hypothetical protein